MSAIKSVLIVTDGTARVMEMAQKISENLKGTNTLIKDASGFAGTDLLPAEVVFIGCTEPSPPSFAYLDEMLQHINLAGRKCGIFSPSSKKALQYLKRMLKSSEISLSKETLSETNLADVKKWTAGVLAGK